jgi:hypothetical protein
MFHIQVPGISEKELSSVRKAFAESAKTRAEHRELGHYIEGAFVGGYYPLLIEGRKFIVAPFRIFEVILRAVLPEANQKYAECFGIYDAYAIMEAMHRIEPTGWDLSGFIEWLSKDKFAYIFEVLNEEVVGEILRLELFNKIDRDKKNPSRSLFTGGIFHAFKHFAFNGNPLSTQPSQNNINHPYDIVNLAIQAFFIAQTTKVNNPKHPKPSIQSDVKFNSKTILSVFYFEEETGHYYVKSMHPK